MKLSGTIDNKRNPLIGAITDLISRYGRYSRDEILAMKNIAALQFQYNSIFALSTNEGILEAIDTSLDEHLLVEIKTDSGYRKRLHVTGKDSELSQSTLLRSSLEIGECSRCGNIVLLDRLGQEVMHPFTSGTRCHQLKSYMRIPERESNGKKYYIVGARAFIGVLSEKSNTAYEMLLPSTVRFNGNRIPQLIHAWKMLQNDPQTMERRKRHYPAVQFSYSDVLAIEAFLDTDGDSIV